MKKAWICISLLLFGTSAVPSSSAEEQYGYPAWREIMRITDQGVGPAAVKMKAVDGSVFFLNSTSGSQIDLSIEFGAHRYHCSNPNLKLDENGNLHSIKPLGPRNFAATCFPEKGSYRVIARGLPKFPNGAQGVVTIE
jgi:hypothetical protein